VLPLSLSFSRFSQSHCFRRGLVLVDRFQPPLHERALTSLSLSADARQVYPSFGLPPWSKNMPSSVPLREWYLLVFFMVSSDLAIPFLSSGRLILFRVVGFFLLEPLHRDAGPRFASWFHATKPVRSSCSPEAVL